MPSSSHEVHCYRCKRFLGESPVPLRNVGILETRQRDLRDLVPGPRQSWRCECGWMSFFVPDLAEKPTRRYELKQQRA